MKVEAKGDLQVQFTFEQVEVAPQDKLFFKILPAHLFRGSVIRRGDAFRTQPIGTGPYKLVSYNEDNSITFARNADFRDTVGVRELVMRELSARIRTGLGTCFALLTLIVQRKCVYFGLRRRHIY